MKIQKHAKKNNIKKLIKQPFGYVKRIDPKDSDSKNHLTTHSTSFLTNLRGHLKKTKPLLLGLNHLVIKGNKET